MHKYHSKQVAKLRNKVLHQFRADAEIRKLPQIAGGSDTEPLAVGGPPKAFAQCGMIGDVTGNNFHGNYACFDLGLQFGNPNQGGGIWAPNGVSGTTQPGPGLKLFAGYGAPPPLAYDANGLNQQNTWNIGLPGQYIGSMYIQVDTGGIFWWSGGAWTKVTV
jgi:hypothetical protein